MLCRRSRLEACEELGAEERGQDQAGQPVPALPTEGVDGGDRCLTRLFGKGA